MGQNIWRKREMKRFFCIALCAVMALGTGMMLLGCEAKEPEKTKPIYAADDLEPSEKLTKENYKKLLLNMTLQQVERYIGKGKKTGEDEISGSKLEIYQWAGTNDEWLKVVFTDGKATRFESYKLKEEKKEQPSQE